MDHTDPQEDCSTRTIARNGVGAIAVCRGCGSVHLALQYLSLRFQPDAFRELAGLLLEAQRRIDIDAAQLREPAPVPLADKTIH